jgi:hypothetical protein
MHTGGRYVSSPWHIASSHGGPPGEAAIVCGHIVGLTPDYRFGIIGAPSGSQVATVLASPNNSKGAVLFSTNGSSFELPAKVVGPGTVSLAAGSATLVGTGTNFTQLAVGDIIRIDRLNTVPSGPSWPPEYISPYFQVGAVADATHLTVERTLLSSTFYLPSVAEGAIDSTWSYARSWQRGWLRFLASGGGNSLIWLAESAVFNNEFLRVSTDAFKTPGTPKTGDMWTNISPGGGTVTRDPYVVYGT